MSENVKPRKNDKGKSFCGDCGEQIFFFWKQKPRYCAMCGSGIDWTEDRTEAEQLGECVKKAENMNSIYTHVPTTLARKILDKLEEIERAEKVVEDETAPDETEETPEEVAK